MRINITRLTLILGMVITFLMLVFTGEDILTLRDDTFWIGLGALLLGVLGTFNDIEVDEDIE